jgi:hypothetical protein
MAVVDNDTHRLTAIDGVVGDGEPERSKSISPPITKLIIAPAPRIPESTTCTSRNSRAIARRIKATPAQFTGRLSKDNEGQENADDSHNPVWQYVVFSQPQNGRGITAFEQKNAAAQEHRHPQR